MAHPLRYFSRRDVARLLPLDVCIPAVRDAFRDHALGRSLGSGVLGLHTGNGGFHIKAAGLGGDHPLFATKINGNFAGNAARGLPRIQGLVVLCDARDGTPLAIMDSIEITALRTAAATAVAADALARRDAGTVTIAGCGVQAPYQLRALALVRPLRRVWAYDTDPARAEALAAQVGRSLGVPAATTPDLASAAAASDIVITCTSAERPILFVGDVRPGTFIAAVGADSDTKSELDPALMAGAAVVPDLTEQAAFIGDLHHALAAGVMTREDVRGELGGVLSGTACGRRGEDEVVVFDSTGTALQDVAAAAAVYQRALARGVGILLDQGPAPAGAFGPTCRVTM
jgi:alanine dehydrogenase